MASDLEEDPVREDAVSDLGRILAAVEGGGVWAVISPNDSTAAVFRTEEEAEAALESVPGGILVEAVGPVVSYMEANGDLTVEAADRIPSDGDEAAELARGYAETVWFDLSGASPGDVVEAAVTTAD